MSEIKRGTGAVRSDAFLNDTLDALSDSLDAMLSTDGESLLLILKAQMIVDRMRDQVAEHHDFDLDLMSAVNALVREVEERAHATRESEKRSETNRNNAKAPRKDVSAEEIRAHREQYVKDNGSLSGWVSDACAHFRITAKTLHRKESK